MAVTIKDVAKRVGVTPATVSMVINKSTKISDHTRDKVLKAIKEMEYHPNYIGRSLVKGKSNAIAIVAPFFSSMFSMEVLKGVEAAIGNTNYSVMLFSTVGKDANGSESLREILYGKRADGVIVLSLKVQKEVVNEFKKEGIPLISIEEIVENIPVIKVDNIKGAYNAVSYLIQKKRKHIALIVGKQCLDAEERVQGYAKALAENQIKYDATKVFRVKEHSFEEGKAMFEFLMKKRNRFDAVFCAAGDLTAIGIMEEAKARGVKIPEDLAIVGYDDNYIAGFTTPALTTVRQPLYQMGRTAFDLLISVIEKKEPYDNRIVSFEPALISRTSA
ncbi:MAG: LacI family DNA-binding transcriptional regulator [bacterium]